MNNFNFLCDTKFIFGKETEKAVGSEIKQYGKKVLFVNDGGDYLKTTGLYDSVVDSIKSENLQFIELSGVKANPEVELVRKGIDICKKENIDFILAVGGGSVIDTAKSIGVGVYYDGDVWDIYEGKGRINDTLPVGVVLTIPATGSEASISAILTNGHSKKAIDDTRIRPVFAVMNPELTYSLPPFQTTAGCVDIISHVFERYFTNTKHVGFTDRLCESTIKTIIDNVYKVMKNPRNYEARAEIMWAGTIAHNGILGVGRDECWGAHMIGHELSGEYNITHGTTLALILPHWMKYVYKHDVMRFVRYAVEVWGISQNYDNPEETALAGIEKTKEFFESVGQPTSLKDVNIGDEKIVTMAEKCTKNGNIGGFVSLNKEDVINIYKSALA
ncbi:iron-containing alcohol dehydrogenase [Anaerofustis stercorihominis]|uniref:iron-containing alcohol dehydrogenase n=1 Tax=Anaerofustis stercorihominis TaxID=214853 RepID=UPI003994EB0D